MTTQRGGRLGLLGPALWTGVVLIMLGTVYPVKAADDAAKAEAERLAAELRQSKQQLTALGAEFEKLRADFKDEQLKNAIDVDQEVKRLRDLLRASPEKEALEQALARAKADAAALEKKHAAQVDALRAEAERNADQARFAAKAQAEVERLNRALAQKSEDAKAYEVQIANLLDQIAGLKRQLRAAKGGKTEDPPTPPRIDPKPDDGPTAEQLKRLQEALRRREDETRRAEDKARADAAVREKEAQKGQGDRPTEELRRLTDELRRRELEAREQAEKARAQADQALQQAEKARREAEAREKDARATAVDPGRLEAEIRAARLEAQLQVMKAAYDDLRQETNRLRKELDNERRGHLERGPGMDPRVEQRLDQLQAHVMKLSTVVDTLIKRLEAVRPEK